MELLPRHERQIKEQMRAYKDIHEKNLTTRQWIETLLSLGDAEIERQRHLLHSGILVEKK